MKITARVRSTNTWPSDSGAIVLAAILIMFVIGLHTLHFSSRNYREDEINTIHAANVLSASEVAQWITLEGFHPAAWRVLATDWVRAFGGYEPVTRYFSTLFTLITLALVYRLGADLFDQQTGLIAVLLLGALPFFQFYGHEFRPYAMLAMSVAGMQFAFIRWLRHQNFRYALLYVGFGVAALNAHFFAVYFLAAQAITALILLKRDRATMIRAVGLFAAIGLSFIPAMLGIVHGALAVSKQGISYGQPSNARGLLNLNQNMQGLPILLVPGMLIPVGAIFSFYKYRNPIAALRFNPEWRRWYLILMVMFSILLAFIGNVVLANLTPRNLMIIMPALALLGAYEVRAFRREVRSVIVGLLILMGIIFFYGYAPNTPYREIQAFMSETYRPGDRIITNLNDNGAAPTAMAYFLMDWLNAEKQDMFHIAEPGIQATFALPPDPLTIHTSDDDTQRAAFEQFLEGANRVFFIDYYGPPLYEDKPLTAQYLAWLNVNFTPVRSMTWMTPIPDSTDPDTYFAVTEYARQGVNP